MRVPLLLALAVVTLDACASRAASVPVLASSADASALVGRWAGEYSSSSTGRSGSIIFDLRSAGDTAHGDVVMTPRGSNLPYRPAESKASSGEAHAPSSQVLTIDFVRVAGPVVTGTLAPYADPECGCPVRTTFTGTIRGETIDGTFVTRGLPGGSEPTGEWRVKRQR